MGCSEQALFELSERCRLPVLLRTTTQVCHTRAQIELGELRPMQIDGFKRTPGKYVPVPHNARRMRVEIDDRLDTARSFISEHGLLTTRGEGRLGILATGAPAAVVQAMRWTRDAGRVVIAGQYTDGGDIAFNPHRDLNRKHLDIRGCWGSDFSHFHRGVKILEDPERSGRWASVAMMIRPVRLSWRASSCTCGSLPTTRVA